MKVEVTLLPQHYEIPASGLNEGDWFVDSEVLCCVVAKERVLPPAYFERNIVTAMRVGESGCWVRNLPPDARVKLVKSLKIIAET